MRGLIGSVLIYLGALATTQGGPLHEAVKSGDLTAIAAALDAGADIEEQDKGATPLFLAIRSEHPEAAELLVKRRQREQGVGDRPADHRCRPEQLRRSHASAIGAWC